MKSLYRATYRVIKTYPNAQTKDFHTKELRHAYRTFSHDPQSAYIGYLVALETCTLLTYYAKKHNYTPQSIYNLKK